MRCNLLPILLVAIFAHGLHAQPIVKFTRYTTTEGLVNNDILSIYQDTFGFIWFGTKSGCSRFDGVEFKNFQYDEGIPGTINNGWVQKIISDNKQNLWFLIAGLGGSLMQYDYEKDKFINVSTAITDHLNIQKRMFEIWRLYPDSNGGIWTETPKYGFIRYNYKQNTVDIFNKTTNTFIVNPTSYKFSENDLWFTSETGIYIYHFETNTFINFKHDPDNPQSLSSDKSSSIIRDSQGDLWIATFNGLNKMVVSASGAIHFEHFMHDPQNPFSLSSNLIYDIEEDNNGNLLIATVNGFCIMDRNKNKTYRYFNNEVDHESINSNLIRTIFKDKTGNIWLGTDAGVGKLQVKNFTSYSRSIYKNSISHNKVQYFCELPNSDIWIATPKGIDVFDRKNKKFNSFLGITHNNKGLYGAPLVFQPSADNGMWIGTWNGGLSYFDLSKKKITNFITRPKTKNISNIFTLYADSKNNLWISSEKQGVYVFNKQNGVFKTFSYDENRNTSLSSDYIYNITEDSDSNIWIGTTNGINQLINSDKGDFKKFLHDIYIKQIIKASDNFLWIATNKGLYRFDPSLEEFKKIYIGNGIPGGTIISVLEDSMRNFWISTPKGFAKLTIRNDSVVNITEYHREDGITIGEFIDRSCIKLKDGTMMFGGTKGFCMFNPSDVKSDTLPPKIVFTNLRVGNKNVEPGQEINGQVILQKSITLTNHITLNYKNNAFSVQFAGLQYNMPQYNKYSYKLFGYEKNYPEWYFANAKNRKAEFINLPAGDYTLKVKAANSYGIWNQTPAELKITILPPWWFSYWFISLMIISLVLLVVLIVKLRTLNLLKQKQKLEEVVKDRTFELLEMNEILKEGKEEIEQQMMQMVQLNKKLEDKSLQIEQMANQLHEADQLKLKFFANISHELRTPLTLILGPLEKCLHLADWNREKIQTYHQLMYKNGQRLLRLINQLIGFRKIEQGGKKLSISNNNIIEFVNDVVNAFQPMAEGKGIKLAVKSEELRVKNTDVNESNHLITHHSSLITQFWFDADVMEKILYNLISNAIKYTPDGGEILIEIGIVETRLIASLQNQLAIKISDTGIGIKPENLNKVFDRFYRAENVQGDDMGGAGIGLAYTKELVELHQGNISVESKPGEGSTFTLSLPIGKSHYNNELIHEQANPSNLKFIHSMIGTTWNVQADTEYSTKEEQVPNKTLHNQTVLIVEDNSDLRKFIKSELETEYMVYDAINGEEGWELVAEKNPGLVISDIMMPVMDGIALCKMIKADENTSHIPVILLTAKEGDMNMLEGLKTGAGDYITKPFNMDILKAKINNLFNQQQQLKERFAKSIHISPSDVTTSIIDEQFLQQAMDVVSEKMGNPEFNNDRFVELMNYSRAMVYKKIKSITGQSVSEFIRGIRLKTAVRLFENGHESISDVSYNVGFNHPNTFTNYFTKTFGIPPRDYIKNLKANK